MAAGPAASQRAPAPARRGPSQLIRASHEACARVPFVHVFSGVALLPAAFLKAHLPQWVAATASPKELPEDALQSAAKELLHQLEEGLPRKLIRASHEACARVPFVHVFSGVALLPAAFLKAHLPQWVAATASPKELPEDALQSAAKELLHQLEEGLPRKLIRASHEACARVPFVHVFSGVALLPAAFLKAHLPQWVAATASPKELPEDALQSAAKELLHQLEEGLPRKLIRASHEACARVPFVHVFSGVALLPAAFLKAHLPQWVAATASPKELPEDALQSAAKELLHQLEEGLPRKLIRASHEACARVPFVHVFSGVALLPAAFLKAHLPQWVAATASPKELPEDALQSAAKELLHQLEEGLPRKLIRASHEACARVPFVHVFSGVALLPAAFLKAHLPQWVAATASPKELPEDALQSAAKELLHQLEEGLPRKLIRASHEACARVPFVHVFSGVALLPAAFLKAHLPQWVAATASPKELPEDALQSAAKELLHQLEEGLPRKLIRASHEACARVPFVHVFSGVALLPAAFLKAHLPQWVAATASPKELPEDALQSAAKELLHQLEEGLPSLVQVLRAELCPWLVTMATPISSKYDRVQKPTKVCAVDHLKLLEEGITRATRMHHLLRLVIDLHVALEATEAAYKGPGITIGVGLGSMIHAMHEHMREMLSILKDAFQVELNSITANSSDGSFFSSFKRNKGADMKLLDSHAAVSISMEVLKGCASPVSQATLGLTLDIVTGLRQGKDQRLVELRDCTQLLECVAELTQRAEDATDCSFLMWHTEMLATSLASLYSSPLRAGKINHVLLAYLDGVRMLRSGGADRITIKDYVDLIDETLTHEVIEPLCHDVETDLRLHVHSARISGAVSVNPTKTGIRDLAWFTQMSPFWLAGKRVCTKARVESYLDSSFYNHCAVALHNRKAPDAEQTYEEMHQLAREKYGLTLADVELPGHTQEQGLDVLEVMRNVHLFAANFCYNVNLQLFVEQVSKAQDRKHVGILTVHHVANSVRAHGAGIITTTVNFAYQFLARKFVIFSQFLYDDHVKSRIIKEVRFWKGASEAPGQGKGRRRKEYPFGRAECFDEDMAKLGLADDGHNFLGRFRQLITEMGNTLALVRLVSSGMLQRGHASASFIPGLYESYLYQDNAQSAGMTSETVEAAKILDTAMQNLRSSTSAEPTQYFHLLVDVYAQTLRSPESSHLRDFYLTVPALTVNAVNSILQGREQLSRRRGGASSTTLADDGFMLGVAYILRVLQQEKVFAALHWFQSVSSHFDMQVAQINETIEGDSTGSGMMGLQMWSWKVASTSVEDVQKLELSTERLRSVNCEYEYLQNTFSIASTLLR
eukprot:SM000104S09329  [mRNA]  locus=s104:89697:101114:+ [translate_table: standard]